MSLDLYPEIIHEGDLSPDAVGSEVDEICNEIHAACKGVSIFGNCRVDARFWSHESRLLTFTFMHGFVLWCY